MNILASLQKFNNFMFEKYSVDGGKMLIHTGALGWVFSSLAQIFVVATDKKISKKDKKFLVPQEICDGATNVALYYTVSKIIKSSGDYAVNNGYLLTDDALKPLSMLKAEAVSAREAVKGLYETLEKYDAPALNPKQGKLNNILNNYEKFDTYNALTPAQKEELKKILPAAMEKINGFKGGLGVVTSIIASIIASNLLTPIVRNKMAGLYQQKFLMQHDESQRAKTYAPQPLPATFNAFKMPSGLKI